MWGSNKVEKMYDDMYNLLRGTRYDVTKFVDGNKSAGTRVRRVMQSIKKLAQEVRIEIQDQKNRG